MNDAKKFATYTVWNTPPDQWVPIPIKDLTEEDLVRIRKELAEKIKARRKQQTKRKCVSFHWAALWRRLD